MNHKIEVSRCRILSGYMALARDRNNQIIQVIFGDSPDAARGRMRRWFSRAGEAK